MASKKISMISKKHYELEIIYEKIKEAFEKRKYIKIECKDVITREFYDARVLLSIYEAFFARTGSYCSLVIMFTETNGIQKADIISTGGKEIIFSFGVEKDFARYAQEALSDCGFQLE